MGSTSLCSVLMRKRDRRSHAESQINHKQHLHAKNKHPFPPGRCSPVPIWHMVWCGGRGCELDLRPYLLPWPEIFVQYTNHTTKCNGPECFYNGKALLQLSFYFIDFCSNIYYLFFLLTLDLICSSLFQFPKRVT